MTTYPNDLKLLHCPALSAIKAISGKWKTRILWLLRERRYHFGELRQILRGVSAKVLNEQIKQLEADGLIIRQEEMRQGIAYSFFVYSDYGRSIIPVLDELGTWGAEHARRQEQKRLDSSDLKQADLRGADLTGASLDGIDSSGARCAE